MVKVTGIANGEIENQQSLFVLIDRDQAGVPYNDTNGTTLASNWAPNAIAEPSVIFLAMAQSDVVGDCMESHIKAKAGS